MDMNIRDLELETLASLRAKAKEIGMSDFMELPKRD